MKYHKDYELQMTEDEQKYHEHLKKIDMLLDKVIDCKAFAETSHANSLFKNFLSSFEIFINVDIDLTFILSVNGLTFEHNPNLCGEENILLLEEWIFTNFNNLTFKNFNESTLAIKFFNKILEIFHLYSSVMFEQFYCK